MGAAAKEAARQELQERAALQIKEGVEATPKPAPPLPAQPEAKAMQKASPSKQASPVYPAAKRRRTNATG